MQQAEAAHTARRTPLDDRPAMLPHRLDRAERPPEPLLPQLPDGRGRLRPGDGGLLVDGTPPRAADRDGEVGVLGQGPRAEPADRLQHLPPERTARARHGRHRPGDVVHPAVDVEPDHVLDVLQTGEQGLPVGDLDVAGHRAHGRVREGLDQFAYGVRLEQGVPVDHDDQVVRGRGHARVECRRLAPVGQAQDPHPGQSQALHHVGGAVGGAVVDHEDLDRVVAGHGRAHGGGDVGGLVVRGDEHRHRAADRFSPACRMRTSVPGVPPGEDEQHQQPRHCERPDHDQSPLQHRHHRPRGRDQRGQRRPGETVVHGGRVFRVDPDRLADRGEPVALPLQLRDQHVQRRDRLRTVAAGVVQQHGAATPVLRRRVVDDRLDPGTPPVLTVHIGEHADVPVFGRRAHHPVRRIVESPDRGRVRRPEQTGGDPGGPGEHQLRLVQLPFDPPAPRGGQVRMGEGVHPQLGPGAVDALDQLRVPGCHRADHEEGARDVVPVEHLQHPRRPGGVRTVVEGQGDRAVRQSGGDHLVAGGVDDRAPLEDRGGHRAVAGELPFRVRVVADLRIGPPRDEQHRHEQHAHDGDDDPRPPYPHGRPLTGRTGATSARARAPRSA